MGPRVRTATAACVLTTGLLLLGGGSAVAFADTPSADSGPPTKGSDDSVRDGSGTEAAGTEAAGTEAVGKDAAGKDAVDSGRPAKSRRAGTDPTGATGDDEAPKPGAGGDDHGTGDGNWWPPCCEGGEDECGPGWHWPWPLDPDESSSHDGDYGEGRPVTLPPMGPMPPMGGGPGGASVLDTVPGVGTGQPTQAPISVPIIVTSPAGLGPIAAPRIAGAPSAAGSGGGTPSAPRQPAASSPSPASVPSPRRLSPETAGSGTATPASMSRIGYAEHLRGAGLPQLAALALPGLAGILVLTGAGGLVGYRQARAGQGVHPTGMVRFMNEK